MEREVLIEVSGDTISLGSVQDLVDPEIPSIREGVRNELEEIVRTIVSDLLLDDDGSEAEIIVRIN